MLSDPDVKKHLEEFHQKIVIITIDKASNNFLFIFRKCYISKLLTEFPPNKKNATTLYSETQKSKEELIEINIKYCKKNNLKMTESDRNLLTKYPLGPSWCRIHNYLKKLQYYASAGCDV